MALTTVKSIGKALNLIDSKKENLKRAFEALQSHASSLSSFNFTWADLDSYFTSVERDLLDKFSTLQALEPLQTSKPKPKERKDSYLYEPVAARPELKSLCQKMDGLGLLFYVIERPKERTAIRVELADALKHAPEPGSMVLDALEGFWGGDLGWGSSLRAACVVLLEELMRAEVEIGSEARKRAMAVAAAWKGKMAELYGAIGDDGDKEGKEEGGLVPLCYLQLLATFNLLSDGGHDLDELVDYLSLLGRYRQAVGLCRMLGLESKISDVIERLIIRGKRLMALKFIFDFDLTDEFPPVPLLKAYVMESKEIAQQFRENGKSSRQSLNDAAVKEISALKSVIKFIEEHDLESQYPKEELVSRIQKLEKDKADRKRPARPPQQVKRSKQNGSKRMRTAAGPPKRKFPSKAAVPPSQKSSVMRASLLPDRAAPYHSSPAGGYGMAGSLVATPYMGSSAELYGLSGASIGFSGGQNPSTSNPYPSETHAAPRYYDRTISYGGYEVPSQYRPLHYYPQ